MLTLTWLMAKIRRLPLWGRVLAWPVFGLIWLTCQILDALFWALKEMAGRAKGRAKKFFAPFLWPAVLAFAFLALAKFGSQELLSQIFGPLLLVGLMLLGLRIMVSGIWPMGKRKKKKK